MAEKVLAHGEIVSKTLQNDYFSAGTKIVTFPFKWIINDFTYYIRVCSPLCTPNFTTKDSKQLEWCISLEPNAGINEQITIRLKYLSRKTYPTMKVNCKLSILNAQKWKIMLCDCPIDEVNDSSRDMTCLRQDVVISKANKLLSGDQLTILFELRITEDKIIPLSEMYTNPNEVQNWQLQKSLGDILKNHAWSDFTLDTGKQEFRVHKVMLAARSRVFWAMFEHEMKEKNTNRVDITDIDEDVLEEMLLFVYTDKVQNLDKNADRLLAAADKYEIFGLRTMCEEVLFNQLCFENAVPTLIIADLYGARQLKIGSTNFINKYREEVKQTGGFKLLKEASHAHLLFELDLALSSTGQESNEP